MRRGGREIKGTSLCLRDEKMLTLVTGGSAGGKSEYAERHAMSLAGAGGRAYIATMQPFGEEAAARICRHRRMREGRGFVTVERFTDLAGLNLSGLAGVLSPALDGFPAPPCVSVLLEDLGNLLANEMFSQKSPADPDADGAGRGCPDVLEETGEAGAATACRGRDVGPDVPEGGGEAAAAVLAGIEGLLRQCAHLTVVSDEVFSGGDSYSGQTLDWMRGLAYLNAELARRADLVVEVVCGIPTVVSGMGRNFGWERENQAACGSPATVISDRGEEALPSENSPWGKPQTSAGRRGMVFVTGPLYAGKQQCIMELLGWSEEDFGRRAVRDVQELAFREDAELEGLADRLSRYEVVIATEVGGGIVPADADERRRREAAGRLACLLAERAGVVVRVFCGQPQFIKGCPDSLKQKM